MVELSSASGTEFYTRMNLVTTGGLQEHRLKYKFNISLAVCSAS